MLRLASVALASLFAILAQTTSATAVDAVIPVTTEQADVSGQGTTIAQLLAAPPTTVGGQTTTVVAPPIPLGPKASGGKKSAKNSVAPRTATDDERHLILTRKKHEHDPDYVMQSQVNGKGVELRVIGDGVGRHYDDDTSERARRRNRDNPNARTSNYDDDDTLTGADSYYDRDQLIPYKYKKHNGIGLYRPWMFDVKWTYWYCHGYKPYVPGAPDRYSPIMTPYGMYPRGNTIAGGSPVQGAFIGAGPATSSVPVRVAAPQGMLTPSTTSPETVTVPPPGPAVRSYATQPYQGTPSAYTWGTGGTSYVVPWSYPSQYPTHAYGHGIHPGFDDVSYRPRHAGSYSPYVGYYGFGGRFNYGYGPYNYYWNNAGAAGGYGHSGHSQVIMAGPAAGYDPYGGYSAYGGNGASGYSGFGRTGSFNFWLPQSGLQQ